MQGWLSGSGKFRPTGPLTKLQAAKWLIQWLGWSPIAAHASYFKLPFTDTKAISTPDLGSAAIAVDSGMIPLTKGAFQPTATLTVGDAAEALVAAIRADISSQN
jgi:hypothetical protein